MVQIANNIKYDIIKQFNLTTIINKIKHIQQRIQKNLQDNNSNKTIDNDLLLIDIGVELDEIVNPKLPQNQLNEPPTLK